MEPYMPHVLAFSAILAYIALGIVLLRFRGARSPIVIMLIASLVPYGSFLLLSKPLDMLHYTATYFFGLMCFLFFWGGLFKSISVRIICDLLEEDTRTLCVEDIYEKYLLTESFKGRLGILIQSDYLMLDNNGNYKLTVAGQKFVRRVGFIQKIYKISASG